MMKRIWISLAALLLVGIVSGQSEIGQEEDFEDDTVGGNPSATWYTYNRINGNNPGSFALRVASPGLDGTAKLFEAEQLNAVNTQGNTGQFILNSAEQFTTFFFVYSCSAPFTTSVVDFRLDGSTGRAFALRSQVASGNCFLRILDNFCDSDTDIGSSSPAGENFVTAVLDWNAKTIDLDIVGPQAFSGTIPFCQAAATDISTITITKPNLDAATNTHFFDQLQFDGGPLGELAPGAPSEFDTGLIAFITSAGFISAESQFFFALILIGFVTVTTSAASKWVAAGRFKNYLLMGAQALVAVFCVILAFLELWMFLVAFMLGVFAVRGGSEIRNSFHDVRSALDRRREPEAVVEAIQGQMGGVMEVRVDEGPEAGLGDTSEDMEASAAHDGAESQPEAEETTREAEF